MKKKFKYAIYGAIAGLPLSYYFQPELLQKTFGIVDYTLNLHNFAEIDSVLRIQYFTENILKGVAVFAAIGFLIGYIDEEGDKKPNN